MFILCDWPPFISMFCFLFCFLAFYVFPSGQLCGISINEGPIRSTWQWNYETLSWKHLEAFIKWYFKNKSFHHLLYKQPLFPKNRILMKIQKTRLFSYHRNTCKLKLTKIWGNLEFVLSTENSLMCKDLPYFLPAVMFTEFSSANNPQLFIL